jgi:hypothetical protein
VASRLLLEHLQPLNIWLLLAVVVVVVYMPEPTKAVVVLAGI